MTTAKEIVEQFQRTTMAKEVVERLLSEAGITINGSNPWDIKVHDERFYQKALAEQSIGLGEAYTEGWWDCPKLDEFFNRLIRADIEKRVQNNLLQLQIFLAKIFNMQNKSRAISNVRHYDADYELWHIMLDRRMNYSCAYWKNSETLDEAQEAKLELICQKLKLRDRMKILDIGCGWGAFAKYAAENYKVKVVGITLSKKQAEFAQRLCEGLPVEILLQDYRELTGEYDRIVSIEMIEHVGYKNYRIFMKKVHECLKDDGLVLLQTIGGNKSTHETDPWISKHIFPNVVVPSIKQLGSAIENLLVMEDWCNFGPYYDKTLMEWYQNFEKNWAKIEPKFSKSFYRKWTYYLLFLAGCFRARNLQLWQIVLSKRGLPGGYIYEYI